MSRFVREEEALDDWVKLLDMRVQQTRKGGDKFLFEIADVVKNKNTPKTLNGSREGIDLSDRPATLNLLSEWCKRTAVKLKVNINDPRATTLQDILRTAQANHEEVQVGQERAQPDPQIAQQYRPRDDERQRTVLEIMTKADEDSRKTFEETQTKAQQMFNETMLQTMAKAEEEKLKTMAKAEEEKLKTMAKAVEEVRRYLK